MPGSKGLKFEPLWRMCLLLTCGEWMAWSEHRAVTMPGLNTIHVHELIPQPSKYSHNMPVKVHGVLIMGCQA